MKSLKILWKFVTVLMTLVFFKLFVKWKMSLSKSRESFGKPYLALNVRRKYTHRLCLFSTLAENELLKKRPNFESQSVPRGTGSLDGRYNYVPLGSRKPCLYVRSWWPNLEWRMYNSNNLRYIADFLVRCNIIKNIFFQAFNFASNKKNRRFEVRLLKLCQFICEGE